MVEPKVRFPEFKDEWTEHRFGYFVKELDDYTNLSSDYPLLTSSRNGLMFQSEYRENATTSNYDTLFSVVPYGTCTYRHMSDDDIFHFNINTLVEKGLVSKEYPVFCESEKGNLYLLVEYLNSSKRFMGFCREQKKGGTRTRLYFKNLCEFHLFFPELDEQIKIANVLSNIDERISVQQSIISDLEDQKRGLMQKLFNQGVRFKADDGCDYPDWNKEKLGNIGTFNKGAPLSKADISDIGTPLILYGELYTTYKEVTDKIIRKTDRKVSEEFISRAGDVIIPTSGESPEEISTATCVMCDGVILGGDLNIYRSKEIDGRILSYILNYIKKIEIAKLAQGKSIVHVSASELEKIVITYPCQNEQRKIAECLSIFNKKIELEKSILEDWKLIKKGLLQQMFV